MTGNRIDSPALECRFCRIGAGKTHAGYDRVLMESDDYFAIPSIGGFVEGWTLVCAKRHTLNLSQDYREAAFQEFAREVAEVISSAYGDVVVFEHGVSTSGSLTGCGTDHAHLHLVPFRGSFVQQVLANDGKRAWVRTPARDLERAIDGREYLLMADTADELSASVHVSIVDQPQSQFFRKILAAGMGVGGQFDYRLFPFTDSAERTAARLGALAGERLTTAAI
ncbi:hypothetical protein PQQ86_15835 [Paraburkholderia sediminicola]|uniref:HIT family protein n=1 Tax=Paraburkholderia sediminicola TaxID=458836 RepID=UPI0038BC497B